MCRAGGRRCPSHLSRLAREARNAQRRVDYAEYKIKKIDELINSPVNKDNGAMVSKLMAQQSNLMNKRIVSKAKAASLREMYIESIAENALVSDAQQASAGPEQVHTEPLEEDVVQQKQAFSKEYGFVTRDIDELADGVADDEDPEELREISEGILRTAERMSPEEIEAGAEYLNQKSESSPVLTSLHQDLVARAAIKRQEQAHSVTDEDIENMLSDDIDSGESDLKKSINALPPVFGDYKYKNLTGEKLFRDTEEVTTANPELGIYKTKNTGRLADIRYFNPETIRGKIVKSKLTKDSAHEDFGFRKIEPKKVYDIESFNDLKNDEEYMEASQGDLHDMNSQEQSSLTEFTGGTYASINDALYENHEKTRGGVSGYIGRHIDNIDSAMEKSPKRQRYVYRAMGADSAALSGYSSAEKWVDDKFSMGEDVVFDGYQSSSPHNLGFRGFSSQDGVVFEILTPEGVNISSSSLFEQECETLLPRGARYKVVGVQKKVDINFPGHYGGHRKNNNTIVRLVAVNSKGEVLDGSNADEIAPVKKKG